MGQISETQNIDGNNNWNFKLLLTFPMARRPLSNMRITPRNKNEIPKAAKPTPISEIKMQENYVEIQGGCHKYCQKINRIA